MTIPKKLLKIMNRIKSSGFEVYIVGGAVRDMIIGRDPKDWDICTSASYDQLKDIFEDYKKVEVGKNFGILILIEGKDKYEIAGYENWSGIGQELGRRDFTINSMAYDIEKGIVDIYGGKRDIERRVVKTTKKVDRILDADRLRVLRAIRFVGELNFEIDRDILMYMQNQNAILKSISVERINEEFTKILLSENSIKALKLVKKFKLLIEFFQFKTEDTKNYKWYNRLTKNLNLRLAVFLYEFVEKGKTGYRKTLLKLKYSKKIIKNTEEILTLLKKGIDVNNIIDMKRLMSRYSIENINLYLNYIKIGHGKDIENYKMLQNKIITENQPYKISDLEIKGKNIKNMGFHGKDIGKKLNELLDYVIEKPESNNYEALKALVNLDSELVKEKEEKNK